MDEKNKIVALLQKRFGGSSLPGVQVVVGAGVQVVVGENRDIAGPVTGGMVVYGAVKGEKKAASVADRIAHLEPMIREQIEELLAIEERCHLRCYVTADQCRAGIIIPDAVRKNHWPEFLRYSVLFFGPAHEAISTVFQKELQTVARQHGKNQISEEGLYTIPAEVLARLARQNLSATKKEKV
jgi:hypothetical protein